MMNPVVAVPNLVDQVYETVLEAICAGDLRPGEPVVQERIAEELAVSRQPVVQALVLLKKQGFVEPQGKKGHRVTDLSPALAQRIYAIRAALDRLAAMEVARAAPNEPGIVTALKDILKTGRAIVASGSVADLIAADVNFHQTLYALSGNPMIAQTAEVHWHHIRRIMGAVLRDSGQRDDVWREHTDIVMAIIDGDPEQAGQLAERHVTAAAAMLVAHLERSTPSQTELITQNR